MKAELPSWYHCNHEKKKSRQNTAIDNINYHLGAKLNPHLFMKKE